MSENISRLTRSRELNTLFSVANANQKFVDKKENRIVWLMNPLKCLFIFYSINSNYIVNIEIEVNKNIIF